MNTYETMGWLYEIFWKESLWLPAGFTWRNLQSTTKLKKAELKDLYFIPIWVLAILVSRYIFENFIATLLCNKLGIKASLKKQVDKKQKSTSPSRRRVDKNAQRLKKATETCWRSVFYTGMFAYGSFVLFRTDWFWDTSKWLRGYIEEHEFTWDMQYYYFIELSFYFSLLISQFVDIKRRDFYQLFLHHVTTIVLLTISYVTSFYRFGTVIIYLHDAADVWLEAAKLANYAKIQKVCDVLFMVFGVIFFATRLVYYPCWVAYAYFHYSTDYVMSPIQNCMVVLCYLLLVLHCYWGYLIGKMAYKLAIVGKVEKDTRSESEDSD